MCITNDAEVSLSHISTAFLTDQGRVRLSNEDSGSVIQPVATKVLQEKGTLLLVADGMGGCRGGSVASQLAVETVVREYYSIEDTPVDALAQAFHQANRKIYRHSIASEELNGMGTTCTALVIHHGHAHSAHVGDSRLYLVRAGSIYQMTEDHSVVKELVRQGAITAEAARTHPGRNLILRALGSAVHVEVAIWDQPLPVQLDDCFVLCSDGLHSLVTDDEICWETQHGNPAAACARLVATARGRGGYDNITVAIARLDA